MEHTYWQCCRQVTLTFSFLYRWSRAASCSLFTQSGTLESPEIKSLSHSSASFICPGSLEALMPVNILPGGRDNATLRFTQLVRSGCWGRTDVWRALFCTCDCVCCCVCVCMHFTTTICQISSGVGMHVSVWRCACLWVPANAVQSCVNLLLTGVCVCVSSWQCVSLLYYWEMVAQ